jgi:hypothetical protein
MFHQEAKWSITVAREASGKLVRIATNRITARRDASHQATPENPHLSSFVPQQQAAETGGKQCRCPVA